MGSHVDRANLPDLFPTHKHTPQFWESLGRTIATFGFLEWALKRAVSVISMDVECPPEKFEEEYEKWEKNVEMVLSDQLHTLANKFLQSVRKSKNARIPDVDKLVIKIKEAATYRNVLCHGFWNPPDADGKSIPVYLNRQKEKFETEIDAEFLDQIRAHVLELTCAVIDSVTEMGWQFPGTSGPGDKFWSSKG